MRGAGQKDAQPFVVIKFNLCLSPFVLRPATRSGQKKCLPLGCVYLRKLDPQESPEDQVAGRRQSLAGGLAAASFIWGGRPLL